jgi:transcriptional regulator with XRE-family HTH domain
MEIFKNIKFFREKKGYSQEVIANTLSSDVSVISNIENGKRPVRFFELVIIANCLEMEVIDLITYPEVYVKKTNDLNLLQSPVEYYGKEEKEKIILILENRILFQEKLINDLITKIK